MMRSQRKRVPFIPPASVDDMDDVYVRESVGKDMRVENGWDDWNGGRPGTTGQRAAARGRTVHPSCAKQATSHASAAARQARRVRRYWGNRGGSWNGGRLGEWGVKGDPTTRSGRKGEA